MLADGSAEICAYANAQVAEAFRGLDAMVGRLWKDAGPVPPSESGGEAVGLLEAERPRVALGAKDDVLTSVQLAR